MTANETSSMPYLFDEALHTHTMSEKGVGAARQGWQRNILSTRAARPHGYASGSGECRPSGLTPELHGREVGKGRGTGTSPASAERLVVTPHGLRPVRGLSHGWGHGVRAGAARLIKRLIAVLQQELAKWAW